MFFNKEDRFTQTRIELKLDIILRKLFGDEEVPNLSRIKAETKEEVTNVYGTNSHEAIVKEEDEEIIDRISSRFTGKDKESFMFEEEALTTEELEAME